MEESPWFSALFSPALFFVYFERMLIGLLLAVIVENGF